MSEIKIDARGLSCPQPVVLTQKAINDGNDNFQVIVNSEVSKENVIRCLNKNKMKSEIYNDGENFIISTSGK